MSSLCEISIGSVAFVGNYPPRRCGIATFTHDIRMAVAEAFPQTECQVCAVNDKGHIYQYDEPVRYEIEQHELNTYLRAADFLNLNNIDVVCIQHEYGIYGGSDGSYVLDMAAKIRAPIVTTLHTVMEHPTPEQDRVMRGLLSLSARVIVMSKHARTLLTRVYQVPQGMIDLIPHGIPDIPFVDTAFYKHKIGIDGKFMLLTFGLLSANKGLENVIEAMPAILKEFPDVVYVILGATHPNVLNSEGEAYRERLMSRVNDLGLADSVQFHDRYVDIEELKEFIAGADMYITPYLDSAQVTSGTLAYAFGCGKPVISTPYLHARELLEEDRGVIVPFANPGAIADAALSLLRDESRRNAMRRGAYMLGREMIWSEVAKKNMESFKAARLSISNGYARDARSDDLARIGRPVPPINLSHLRRLTDSTGIMQHALYTLPRLADGYCTDDNARALMLTHLMDSARVPEFYGRVDGLTPVYAAFLNNAFNPDTRLFRNFMSYDRRWMEDVGSDDCQGRCVRALGICVEKSGDPHLRQWAACLFKAAAPEILGLTSPRAWAQALLGINSYLAVLSGDTGIRKVAEELEGRLVNLYDSVRSESWPWFETGLTYDCAVLPHALIVHGKYRSTSGDDRMSRIGLEALEWLVSQQKSKSGHFRAIGSNGFYERGGERAMFDQQPIEAAATVLAAVAAYELTGKEYWLQQARIAFDWFHGSNDIKMAVYDASSGGCCDGLSVDRLNRNQGAESTLVYLTARTVLAAVEGSTIPLRSTSKSVNQASTSGASSNIMHSPRRTAGGNAPRTS